MDYLKNFVIPFSGLKIDIHHFEFVIDKKFFDAIEYAEIEHGSVNLDLTLIKQDRMMIFEFDFKGWVEVVCDRCLDKFDHPVVARERLIVKFGEVFEEQSDEVIIIPERTYEFNISPYLYEFIKLSLPMQCIHPDDENENSTCNKEMLDRLSHHHQDTESDSRWDALKKLKEK